MTDTVTCQNCGTSLPSHAAFCTACGTKVGASGGPEPDAAAPVDTVAAEDATRIETPGLHEATRVLPVPPSAGAPVSESPGWAAPPAVGYPPSPAQPADAPPWQPPATTPPPPAWQPPGPSPDWADDAPPGGHAWAPPVAPPQWQQSPPTAWPPETSAAGGTARSTKAAAAPAVLAAVLAFLGAALLVVCVFTLWFKLEGPGRPSRLTGWEMVTKKTKAGPFKSPDPAILIGIAAASTAVGGLLVAGKAKAAMRVLLVLAGGGAALVLVRDYLSIKDTLKRLYTSQDKLTFQYGFWLGCAAAVILIVAAVIPSPKQT